MADNKFKENHTRMSVENHGTAAWANTSDLKPDSNVNIPDEFQVMNAKEHVDENHK